MSNQSDIYTDVYNANRLAVMFDEKLMYVPQSGKWYEFNGTIWKVDDARNVMNKAIEVTRDMLQESAQKMIASSRAAPGSDGQKLMAAQAQKLAQHAISTQSRSKLEAMIKVAEANKKISVSQSLLDANDHLFAVKNGVLDLNKHTFRNGRPSDYLTKNSSATWEGKHEKIGCPLFLDFLTEVQPDPEVRKWLQMFVGYSLSGETGEQIFTVFQGNGSNGKSVFIEIIKLVLGTYAKTVQFDTFTEREKSNIRNDIANLDKVRLVVASEGPDGARLDEGIIKQLTGQDEVTARFLYREFFTFKPRFKIVLVTNHKPVITGTDHGIWRRVVLVPWSVTIPHDKCDKRLQEKLAEELPGILAWCIQGWQMWRENGLSKMPVALLKANNEYRKDSDIIGLWLDDCCSIYTEASCSSADLYANYDQWARSAGFRPASRKTLGDRLREKGFQPGRDSSGRMWSGLTLRERSPYKPYHHPRQI